MKRILSIFSLIFLLYCPPAFAVPIFLVDSSDNALGTAGNPLQTSLAGLGDDLVLENGEKIDNSTDGIICLQGGGGSNNEDICFDLETGTNKTLIKSTTNMNIIEIDAMDMNFLDDDQIRFGNGQDSQIQWDGNGTIDSFQFGTKVGNNDFSGYFSIMEKADISNANREPAANSADPVLRVYSADATVAGDFTEILHNQTDSRIRSGTGTICLQSIEGTNNEDFCFDLETTSNNVLLKSTTGTSKIDFQSFSIFFRDSETYCFGNSEDACFTYDNGTRDSQQLGLVVGSDDQTGYFSIVEKADIGNANREPAASSADPVLRVYSSDATVAGDYIEFSHDQTDGVIASGGGAVVFNPGTKHDGYKIRKSAEVQTTDATITVLDTITLLDENTYHFEAFIVAVQSTGAERASYHIAATVFRTGAGSATLQGTVTSLHTQESDANLAATFTVSGSDIRVSVTGIAAETWEWGATVRHINMSN